MKNNLSMTAQIFSPANLSSLPIGTRSAIGHECKRAQRVEAAEPLEQRTV
jgi:hypothetical protein